MPAQCQDGLTWSEPRVGAFNETATFLNGSEMWCRRERPQMILDGSLPIGMASGIQCPRAFGHFKGAHADVYIGAAQALARHHERGRWARRVAT